MAETVLVLALAFDQVQLHRRAAILDAQAAEAQHPTLDRLGERQVGIHLAGDVAAHVEAQIVRLQRAVAVLGLQLVQRALVGVAGAGLEIVRIANS